MPCEHWNPLPGTACGYCEAERKRSSLTAERITTIAATMPEDPGVPLAGRMATPDPLTALRADLARVAGELAEWRRKAGEVGGYYLNALPQRDAARRHAARWKALARDLRRGRLNALTAVDYLGARCGKAEADRDALRAALREVVETVDAVEAHCPFDDDAGPYERRAEALARARAVLGEGGDDG